LGNTTSAEHSSTAETPTNDFCIFWIKGSAGTGKTTIAYSIAEDCRKHNVLGASFFCSRDWVFGQHTSAVGRPEWRPPTHAQGAYQFRLFGRILLRWYPCRVWVSGRHTLAVGRSEWCTSEHVQGSYGLCLLGRIFPRWHLCCVWVIGQHTSAVGRREWRASAHPRGAYRLDLFGRILLKWHPCCSGSSDNTLRLWDAVSGAHQNTLEGHTGAVTLVAFSPDGTRVVSGSWDNTLRLWDAVTGVHLNTHEGHYSAVPSVALSTTSTPTLESGSAAPLFGHVMKDG
jgi:hypothetical protein